MDGLPSGGESSRRNDYGDNYNYSRGGRGRYRGRNRQERQGDGSFHRSEGEGNFRGGNNHGGFGGRRGRGRGGHQGVSAESNSEFYRGGRNRGGGQFNQVKQLMSLDLNGPTNQQHLENENTGNRDMDQGYNNVQPTEIESTEGSRAQRGGSHRYQPRPYSDKRGRERYFQDTRQRGFQSDLNPNATAFQPQPLLDTGELQQRENSRVKTSRDRYDGYNKFSNQQQPSNSNRNMRRNQNYKTDKGYDRHLKVSPSECEDDNNDKLERVEEVQPRNFNTDNRFQPKNQREVLMDQLSRNVYECMVCCEKVRYSNPVWSCKRCFNVFHLHCIKKWASSSADETGWRCPGCQSYCDVSPSSYYCFCGKTKNPKASRYEVPHTCGQICSKVSPGGLKCDHTCNSVCHPGPCPMCEIQQKRYCGCGQTNATVLCGSKVVLACGGICSKTLECGFHKCSRECHQNECGPCEETLTHECHCGKETKAVACTPYSNEIKVYSCPNICGKPLSCGEHGCEKTCHAGACGPCKTSVEVIISCPCGQTAIAETCAVAKLPRRKKCTDQIPTCGKICSKILACGTTTDHHRCKHKCHLEKSCPTCPLVSKITCRCGTKLVEIPCKELVSSRSEITCQKKCTKKRSCGKHKCTEKCCIDIDHVCPVLCQRQLRCGNHSCPNLCHLNPCPPCSVVSFDELACECGASVIYPPVPCGTRRPPCQLPCSRQHDCDHPVHHPCHSEPNCSPCTVLTEKWCHGRHELRKTIMCYITEFSCGLSCSKGLSCERHKCPKTCHAGVCLEENEICKLPCDKHRKCGHKCSAPCHEGDCPDSKCKIITNVVCPCGRREDTLICWRREIEHDRTVTWEYHQELKKLEESMKRKEDSNGNTIDDVLKQEIMRKCLEKIPKSMVLECDKECAKVERNRKLVEALQLDGADVTTSLGTPNYSEFLLKFTKKNPQFVEMIHKQLKDLVMKAKQSKKKNETYGFNSMNRDKRHLVHEYSDHFGILSESFDEEPNRNVVCFASKEKSYLPSVSLVDAAFRPNVLSQRLKPYDDIVFSSDKRTQIVGPSNWNISTNKSSNSTGFVALNTPTVFSESPDFPPL